MKKLVCETLEFGVGDDEQPKIPEIEDVRKALAGHQVKYEPFDMELNEEEKYLQETFEIE